MAAMHNIFFFLFVLVLFLYCTGFIVITGARPSLRKKLIADSMCKHVYHLPNTEVICKPGITLATIAESIFEELRYCAQNADIIIIHAGTNDINETSINELLGIVANMVRKYRSSFCGHIALSTIIPRPRDGRAMASKVKAWCSANGCVCLRTHGPFLKGGRPREELFNRGRLHLQDRGPFPTGRRETLWCRRSAIAFS